MSSLAVQGDVRPHRLVEALRVVGLYLLREGRSVPLFMWVYLLGLFLACRHFMKVYNGTVTVTRRLYGKGTRVILSKDEDTIASALIDISTLTQTFADVGGLEEVKRALREGVVWPVAHPDLFPAGSLRSGVSGVLLHGPPGTGKTLLARALAKEVNGSFLEVKIDLLFNKWVGATEKLVAAIFSVAEKCQPCIVFIDEIDSFLDSRSASDNAVHGHVKALFMTSWDGLLSGVSSRRIVIVGATNRPAEVDEAILRRMPLKLYVPYPTAEGRRQILDVHLCKEPTAQVDVGEIVNRTVDFSGSDLRDLCHEAAMIPVRHRIANGEKTSQVLTTAHFREALKKFRPNRKFLIE